MLEYKLNNKEYFKRYNAKYYTDNKASLNEQGRVWRLNNLDKEKAANKKWRAENKQRKKETNAKWQRANPDKVNAAQMRHHAALITPQWANQFFIDEAYHLAALRSKVTGFKWHVDHIVPRQSKLVCGLHTEHNLRVIPGKENIAKNNRFWPDMP